MTRLNKSPAELRNMFGANLRYLADTYPSISELSRQLGINRTQFNRYLAGESFPRPDILARICDFFDVDARVLLEPVDGLMATGSHLNGPELNDYLGSGATPPEPLFPNGFYRFTRLSFLSPERYVVGLVRVWRNTSGQCFVRGFEAREAMRQQDLPMTAELREFRGAVLQVENGIGSIITRRHAMTASFNFLHPVASFENNFWSGYVTRTVPETLEAARVTRLVYEHLGTSLQRALSVGRKAGLADESEVPSYHLRLLQGQNAFK
ncbi:MAG: helix-turn-helix domain-containing protein [Paracoccaceae bacterium]